MKMSPAIQELIDALRHLPGVGPKSAQRMTLHLLERDREAAESLGEALLNALSRVQQCQRCRNFTELNICEVCGDPKRDDSLLCVVETPADVLAIELTGSYRGLYFVLMGHLSPSMASVRASWDWTNLRGFLLRNRSAKLFSPPIQRWRVKLPVTTSQTWHPETILLSVGLLMASR